MISFGRRGATVLLSIATAGVLTGSVAIAAPATVDPSGLQPLLGADETDTDETDEETDTEIDAERSDEASAAPSRATRPPWRIATPVAVGLPTAPAVPEDPAAALPNPPIDPAAAPPPPDAWSVREMVDSEDPDDEEPDETEQTDDETEDVDETDESDVEAVAVSGSDFVSGVIELTNEERREVGCGALSADARLTRSAQGHASDMAENDYFSHDSKDGTRFDTRIRDEGYPRPGGENIAMGQVSPEQVVREWMASSSHRRAIQNCTFRTIGVGHDDSYWVQDFGV